MTACPNYFSNIDNSVKGYCFIHQGNNRNKRICEAILELLLEDNRKDYNKSPLQNETMSYLTVTSMNYLKAGFH